MTLAPAVGLGVPWVVVVVAFAYVRDERVAIISKPLRCMMGNRRQFVLKKSSWGLRLL